MFLLKLFPPNLNLTLMDSNKDIFRPHTLEHHQYYDLLLTNQVISRSEYKTNPNNEEETKNLFPNRLRNKVLYRTKIFIPVYLLIRSGHATHGLNEGGPSLNEKSNHYVHYR